MEITKTITDNTANIALTGRLDTLTSSDLEAELETVLDAVQFIVFDFKDLDYISSAGLRVLLTAQKALARKDGHVTITNCSPDVKEVFTITGFADILEIL